MGLYPVGFGLSKCEQLELVGWTLEGRLASVRPPVWGQIGRSQSGALFIELWKIMIHYVTS